MPSLALEENPVQVYPPGASVGSISVEPGLWFVACTMSRQEKRLAFDLAAAGVSYYLPLYRNRTSNRGSRAVTLLPLFPGYLFVHLQGNAYDLFLTRHVIDVLPVHQQERIIRELSLIESAIAHDAVRPYGELVVGRDYAVRGGPFQGITGTLVETDGESRFVMQIETLGRPCILEIQPELLEPV